MCVCSSASSGGESSAGAMMRSGAFYDGLDGRPHRGDDHEAGLHVLAHERRQHRRRLGSVSIARMRGIGRSLGPGGSVASQRGVRIPIRKGSARIAHSMISANGLQNNYLRSYYRAGIGKSLPEARLCSLERLTEVFRAGVKSDRRQTPAQPRCSILAQVSLRVTVRLKTSRPGVESASTQK